MKKNTKPRLTDDEVRAQDAQVDALMTDALMAGTGALKKSTVLNPTPSPRGSVSARRIAALKGGRHIRWVASQNPSFGPIDTFWRKRYVFGAATVRMSYAGPVTRVEAECETEKEAIEGARRLVDSYAACQAFVLDTRTGLLKNWSARYDDAAKVMQKEPPWPGAFTLDGVPTRDTLGRTAAEREAFIGRLSQVIRKREAEEAAP